MTYTKVILTGSRKVAIVITRMQQIKQILEEVEELKKQILLTEYNDKVPFAIKRTRVAEMRESLFLSEHLALKLMQEEIDTMNDGEAA